ncbi:cobalt-precorrin-6A reductase [Amaricoccus sp.]|uniref:cobalt-precorrin-6A reductase n=1 Tax=Amaricoccus sp. TaxID=1872485 RepID=UPI001B765FDE|nr:cobalt-precorrin-6A reductase [Amaricoccus sp.]MBP7241029.1 cobalt-precorrin-6A reductase [Amaricoccus sp.]
MHVLILGGAGEARELARRLSGRPGLRVTLSLAGRTRAPEIPDAAARVGVRVGGFGGADGLADWLRAHAVAVLVDATHPFARRISGNAVRAAAAVAIPLVVLERPPWQAVPGDRWTRVPDMAAAAAALGDAPRRVFLAIGRQEVSAFRAASHHHYLVRSIEPVAPADLPPRAETLLARGPFAEADERALLAARGVEVVVAKNSGGDATYGKIAAARHLGLPVVLVDRPTRPEAAATVEAALARLDHVAGSADRGV